MNQENTSSTQALQPGTTQYAWRVVLVSLAWTATAVASYLAIIAGAQWHHLLIAIATGALAMWATHTVNAADRRYRDELEAVQRQEKYGIVEPSYLDPAWEACMDYLRDMRELRERTGGH